MTSLYKCNCIFLHSQFSSIAQLCLTLCDHMNRSMPGLPVHYQLPESTQTHVHWVGDDIQPSHPLSSPSFFSPQSFPASGCFQMSQLFATSWTATRQASLSITNSRSPPKSTSVELVMPSNHINLCHPFPFSSCPQSLPASGSLPVSQLFASGGQSIRFSASTSVLPMNTQDWSLEWTGWISWQSKGLSRVFSNTTVQKHQFFSVQPSSQSNSHIHTWPLEKP